LYMFMYNLYMYMYNLYIYNLYNFITLYMYNLKNNDK